MLSNSSNLWICAVLNLSNQGSNWTEQNALYKNGTEQLDSFLIFHFVFNWRKPDFPSLQLPRINKKIKPCWDNTCDLWLLHIYIKQPRQQFNYTKSFYWTELNSWIILYFLFLCYWKEPDFPSLRPLLIINKNGALQDIYIYLSTKSNGYLHKTL